MTRRGFVIAAVLLALVTASPSAAQLQLKVGDETTIKFGVLLQGWADWTQDSSSEGYAQNLFLRRARILVGGNVTKDLSFFMETDNPTLGKSSGTAKTISSGFIVQDAFLDWKVAKPLSIQGGLILIPFCRNCLNSAAAMMTMDYSAYSFLQSAATSSVTGRDTGFQARGYVLDDRLEYRVGVFEGARDTGTPASSGSRNSYRDAGRVQYAFLDKEVGGLFYPGSYFGKKKMLIVGGAWDNQRYYSAYAGDVFFDYPVGPGGVTVEGEFIHWDGGRTFTTLKKQNTFNVQAGLWAKETKLFPYVRYEKQHFTDPGADSADQDRYQLGLGYYYAGNNATLKFAYTRVNPKVGTSTNQFTIQLQGFYF